MAALSCTVSRTLMSRSKPPVCITAATWPRAIAPRGVCPKMETLPWSGALNPRIMSIVVVLPAPLGPRNATTSPGCTVKSRPRTAWTFPKLLCNPAAWTAGTLVVVMTFLG